MEFQIFNPTAAHQSPSHRAYPHDYDKRTRAVPSARHVPILSWLHCFHLIWKIHNDLEVDGWLRWYDLRLERYVELSRARWCGSMVERVPRKMSLSVVDVGLQEMLRWPCLSFRRGWNMMGNKIEAFPSFAMLNVSEFYTCKRRSDAVSNRKRTFLNAVYVQQGNDSVCAVLITR